MLLSTQRSSSFISSRFVTRTLLLSLALFSFISCISCLYNSRENIANENIRGKCPRSEDIHPCSCLLLPKHVGDEFEEEEPLEHQRSARSVVTEEADQVSKTTTSLSSLEEIPA